MKKILILWIGLMVSALLSAEVIVLKDGEVIKGSIQSSNETSVTIESNLGMITIAKEKIASIVYNDADYKKEEMTTQENQKKKVSSNKYKSTKKGSYTLNKNFMLDSDYILSKRYQGAGIATVIPGTILLTAGIMMSVSVYSFYYTSVYNQIDYSSPVYNDTPEEDMYTSDGYSIEPYYSATYNLERRHIFQHPYYAFPAVWGLIMGSTGLILDIIAFGCFAQSSKYFEIWKNKVTRASLLMGATTEMAAVGLSVKF